MSQQLASKELEAFCDEGIRVVIKTVGIYPTAFSEMRRLRGTRAAITKLVRRGEIQSGFERLRVLGLLHWSIEAAVLQFPEEFDRETIEAARWRLEQARKS
jgi:hypothetical protein